MKRCFSEVHWNRLEAIRQGGRRHKKVLVVHSARWEPSDLQLRSLQREWLPSTFFSQKSPWPKQGQKHVDQVFCLYYLLQLTLVSSTEDQAAPEFQKISKESSNLQLRSIAFHLLFAEVAMTETRSKTRWPDVLLL